MFTALNTWLRFSDRCGDGSKMLAGLWGWVRTALSRVKSDSFVDPSIWTSPLCRLLGLVTGEAAHPTTTISYVGCDVSIFSQCGSCNIGHPTDYAVSVFSFLTDESFMCLTKHEPVGVCGAIIPVSGDLIWILYLNRNSFSEMSLKIKHDTDIHLGAYTKYKKMADNIAVDVLLRFVWEPVRGHKSVYMVTLWGLKSPQRVS